MNIEERQSSCFRFSVQREGSDVGRAYLYLIYNDLHDAPCGFMEDVFVEESYRGQGIGTELTNAVIAKAKEVAAAIKKAVDRARKSMVSINMVNDTIPHAVDSSFGAAYVLLKPARPGTGVIAGGAVRILLESAGLKNVVAKSLRSQNI